MSHLNHEHYSDPTAGIALGNLKKKSGFRVVAIETDSQRKRRKREEAARAARREQEQIAIKRKQAKKLARQNLNIENQARALEKFRIKLTDLQRYVESAYVGEKDAAFMRELQRMKVAANLHLSRYGNLLMDLVGKNEVTGDA